MPPVIPKEDILAIATWQARDFAPPVIIETPAPVAKEGEADAGEAVAEFTLPTAEDIERIQNDAQREGYDLGFSTGKQEGFDAGMADARSQGERLTALADNFQNALSSLDQTVAETILELALEVARQVVRSTLQQQPENILPLIREAIAALPLHHGNITLFLNPADAALVHEYQAGQATHQSTWHISEDPNIELGGCLVRAGNSEVDASVATRWRHVLAAIGSNQADTP